MSLGSHLLKHLIISRYLHVPWSKFTISRDRHGKPCFLHLPQTTVRVGFNVSHQAGIITLIAAIGDKYEIRVGTDIVCVSERRKSDYAYIEKWGFFDWVDMHKDVFAESELSHMRLGPVSLEETGINLEGAVMKGLGMTTLGRCQRRNEKFDVPVSVAGKSTTIQVDSNVIIDIKLRRFYATWCLREAYVKMTGEALLASWLKELEMVKVEAPRAKKGATDLEEGELLRDFVIYFKKSREIQSRRVMNVKMELIALGADFMIAGAVEIPNDLLESDFMFSTWKNLNLIEDVLEIAESNL